MSETPSPGKELTTLERWQHRFAFWRHRLAGKEYAMTVPMFGQPVTLVVTTSRELKRAAEVSYEGFFLERILSSLKAEDVFFDVGANIGLVSLIVARQPQFNHGRVHGFEPEPRNLEHMRRNIAANDLAASVQAHGVALSKAEGTAELFVRGEAGEGRHSLVSERGSTGAIKVPLTTMDTFCQENRVLPTVIKIDVEGAEGEVLYGMGALLERHRPRELFMEIHNKGGEDKMPDGGLIDDWLTARDYEQIWEKRRGHGRHRHYRDKRA
jgi:FkbM family methyltransferase